MTKININDAKEYLNRGNVKFKMGKKREAIKDYEKSIELNPDNMIKNLIGLVKNALDEHEEVIKYFDKSIELNPNVAESYYKRGLAKNALGDYTEAIKDFDRAIELNSQYAEAISKKRIALEYLKKSKELETLQFKNDE